MEQGQKLNMLKSLYFYCDCRHVGYNAISY